MSAVAYQAGPDPHERDAQGVLPVADEWRRSIAPELHDVVAHHVSAIVVLANALSEAIASDDARHASAEAIVDSGRCALTEMRRVLDLLRANEAESLRRRVPEARLARLDALLNVARRAGLHVELQVEGTERPLPETLEVSAYRIVQESLTNVLRHARAQAVKVRIAYGPMLELEVVDDGARASEQDGQGHGLRGMRERAELFGGQLSSGPADGGGFAVRAIRPLPQRPRG
jgi:signal transduction histidine kinase